MESCVRDSCRPCAGGPSTAGHALDAVPSPPLPTCAALSALSPCGIASSRRIPFCFSFACPASLAVHRCNAECSHASHRRSGYAWAAAAACCTLAVLLAPRRRRCLELPPPTSERCLHPRVKPPRRPS
jgi:hypothetical protein